MLNNLRVKIFFSEFLVAETDQVPRKCFAATQQKVLQLKNKLISGMVISSCVPKRAI